jgi:hypothetical protein
MVKPFFNFVSLFHTLVVCGGLVTTATLVLQKELNKMRQIHKCRILNLFIMFTLKTVYFSVKKRFLRIC